MITSTALFYSILAVLFVLGAWIGRFLNICIVRFPQVDLDSVRAQFGSLRKRPWSLCAGNNCSPRGIGSWPIIGWLISGRRCKGCGRRIATAFTVIELITAVLFVWVYWCEIPFGANASVLDSGLHTNDRVPGPEMIDGLFSATVWLHLRYALHMIMICGLIVATEIDRKLRVIPDGCTIPLMWLAFLWHFAFPQSFLVPLWFQDASLMKQLQPAAPDFLQALFVPFDIAPFANDWPYVHGLLVSLAGAAVGAGVVWIVRQVGFLVLRQEAMGFGDVILMGMIGAVIGWQPVLAVFMIAPVLGIAFALFNAIANRDNMIPYGPFLSAAAIILLLTWPTTWPYAKRFFDLGPVLVAMGVLMIVLLAVSLQLVQILKRLFGFGNEECFFEDGGWNSADHLQYYNSERPDEQTGQWQRPLWPGNRSGRGLGQQQRWRGDR